MDASALQEGTPAFQCETLASQNKFLAMREEFQSIFDNPMLSWLFPIDTPTRHISAELVTIWLVLGSEHLASKLFLGKELELGVPLSMVVEHIKSQAPAPGTSPRHQSQTPQAFRQLPGRDSSQQRRESS